MEWASFIFGFFSGAVPVFLFLAGFHDEDEDGPMHRAWEWLRYR